MGRRRAHRAAIGDARLELPNGERWAYRRGALDAHGTIGTYRCRCLSAPEQLRLHDGYELREIDRADIRLVRAHEASGAPDHL